MTWQLGATVCLAFVITTSATAAQNPPAEAAGAAAWAVVQALTPETQVRVTLTSHAVLEGAFAEASTDAVTVDRTRLVAGEIHTEPGNQVGGRIVLSRTD